MSVACATRARMQNVQVLACAARACMQYLPMAIRMSAFATYTHASMNMRTSLITMHVHACPTVAFG